MVRGTLLGSALQSRVLWRWNAKPNITKFFFHICNLKLPDPILWKIIGRTSFFQRTVIPDTKPNQAKPYVPIKCYHWSFIHIRRVPMISCMIDQPASRIRVMTWHSESWPGTCSRNCSWAVQSYRRSASLRNEPSHIVFFNPLKYQINMTLLKRGGTTEEVSSDTIQ